MVIQMVNIISKGNHKQNYFIKLPFINQNFHLQKSKMGNKVYKDPNVDIIIQPDKNFYYAGQLVTGTIFLNVKNHVNYDALYLRLQGHQFCKWSEGSGKDKRHYQGEKQIYKNEYLVKKYGNGINVGNYKYTFCFTLNRELSGTFNYQKISIYYPLKAILINYNGKKENPEISYNITVIEPMRYPESRFNNAITTQPKTWCCIKQGESQLRVEYPTNHVKPGDQIKVNIFANNRNCEKDIESIQFGFYKNVYATSNKGHFKSWKQNMALQKSKGCAKHSQIRKELSLIIPSVPSNTAFGQITGNYYTLQTKSNIEGCTCSCCGCGNEPLVVDHFYIDAPYYQPPVMKMNNNNTYYMSQQNYRFINSQPFIFSQNTHIKFMNRPIMQYNQFNQVNQNYPIDPTHQTDQSYQFNKTQNNINYPPNQYNSPFQNPQLNTLAPINSEQYGYFKNDSQNGSSGYPY